MIGGDAFSQIVTAFVLIANGCLAIRAIRLQRKEKEI